MNTRNFDPKTPPNFSINLASEGSFDLRTFPSVGDGWIMAFAQMRGGIANVAVGAQVIPNVRPGWIQIQTNDRTVINYGASPATVVFWL